MSITKCIERTENRGKIKKNEEKNAPFLADRMKPMKDIHEADEVYNCSAERDAAEFHHHLNDGMIFSLCSCCNYPCFFISTVCCPGCAAGAQCSALDDRAETDSAFYCMATQFLACLAAPYIRLAIVDKYGNNEWCISSVLKGFFFPWCSLQQTFLELHVLQQGISNNLTCFAPNPVHTGVLAVHGKML